MQKKGWMIERLISGMWLSCELADIKLGDVFRTFDERGQPGPLFRAVSGAYQLATKPGESPRWNVRASLFQLEAVIDGGATQ
ncbi:hypothetical protein [Burkholderia cepacia]|uniref:hypothetical protein n=1 Tax=Burkholderia cepacia TaxID=292 RepID=UPI00158D7448|nr:hypothetical protein [Burkholderia cepacia]